MPGDDSRDVAIDTNPPSRGMVARALLERSHPRKKREQGMPGARCTRGLVCKIVRRNAHEHTGSAETLRHSPRNGFTAYAVLLATNSSCHRRRRIKGFVAPGWADIASANLTPATGARTTRFCRTHQRRSSCAPVDRSRETRPATPLRADAAASTASPPAFVTIAIRPSCRERTGELVALICPTG
jgi:hypothetical protein